MFCSLQWLYGTFSSISIFLKLYVGWDDYEMLMLPSAMLPCCHLPLIQMLPSAIASNAAICHCFKSFYTTSSLNCILKMCFSICSHRCIFAQHWETIVLRRISSLKHTSPILQYLKNTVTFFAKKVYKMYLIAFINTFVTHAYFVISQYQSN
jgi:hypothetical protein